MQRQIARTLLAVLLAAAGSAHAAPPINVNTTNDTTGVSGSTSLRDAINMANMAGKNANTTITFDPKLNGKTIQLMGTLAVALKSGGTLTITGPGAGALTVNGGGNQIFAITAGTIQITGLTLTNGKGTNGGAIDFVSGTSLTVGSTDANGGMVFSNNTATGEGGAIYSAVPVTISVSTFANNSAATGGAIALAGTGADTVEASTFTGNSGSPAGISVGADNAALTLINSTFYNEGSNDLYATKGTVNISSVTFGNTQAGVGTIGVKSGATMTVRSSVVVGCYSPDNNKPTSSGHNLVADGSCNFTATGDMQSAVSALTVFGVVAGTTQTLSPAANTCTPVTNNGDSTNAGLFDQDGKARNASPGAGKTPTDDIGAIEMSSHLPCIDIQPSSVPDAFLGQPTSLSVTTITREYLPSSTYETYQWSKGGTAISGATGATYSIPAVAASDAGSYTVVVTNPFGSVTSSAATITVVGPPVFSTQPSGTSVFPGQSFTLTSAVQNTAGVSYQWYLGNNPVNNATSSSLTVNNAQASNTGSYTVKATNPAGTTTSSAAVVTLNGPPTITSQPGNQTVFAGKPFTLTVGASGQSLSYQWQQSNGSAFVNISGANLASYTVAAAQASDAGNYQVVVTNPAGTVTSATATVTVNGPPVITMQPAASTTIFTTQALNLSVTASGAAPAYQWYLNNSVITGATQSTYSVASAQSTDAGTYYVIVTNGAGFVQSANAVVNIIGPATITSQPVNTTIYANQTLTLSVTATGQQLSYQWQKQQPDSSYANITGATLSTYTKPNATTADAGTYRVQVINPGGTTSSNAAIVTVYGAPTIATQPTGQTVYAGQQFQLSVTGNGQGLQYQWYQGTTAINGANASTYTDASAQLTDAGSYYVVVSNPAGSATSNTVAVVVNGPPAITSQPSAQTIYAGQTLTLTVQASGQGLQYQWQKQGGASFVNINNANAATYTVASAATSDAGNYQVVVTNPAGTVTSNSVAVVVNGAPTITTQPQGQSVFAGQPLQLAVVAAGQGLQYQWLLAAAPIAGATTATYTVASAQQANAGTYTVQVSNPAGVITSNPAVVAIAPAPTITQQPTSQTVYTTQPLTLSVAASGASLTYQWQKQSGAAYSNITGATAASYVVNSVALTDAGNYQVIVTNPAGSVTSSAATVTVNGPPVITVNPVSQMVNAGASVTLTGNASGSDVSFQWQKGGVNISGATSTTFTIMSVQVGDAGTYHLVATNPGGSAVSTDATLSVNGAPTITSQPTAVTVFAGQGFQLSVTATGVMLTYQWFFRGLAISGATASSYSVADAQAANAGYYYVNVTNAAGTVQSNTVAVAVNGAPVITTPPANQTIYAGQPFTLSVSASGASLSYQWQKLSGGSYSAISGATSSTYFVASAAASDAGSYEVTVTNGAGAITSSPATVGVNGAPQITTNPQSQTVFAGAMVTLTGAASGAGLSYQWQFNNANIQGATSATLTFASIQVANAGSYQLVASNPAGAATSNPAIIAVNGAPQITTQPAGQTIFATQPFTLSVTASGAALTYQWSLNGAAISGATSATYGVSSSSATNAGTYTVLVSNGAGALQSNNAVVVVKPAPSITTQPTDQTVFVTQPFTLSVVASGDSLSYQWQLQQGSGSFQDISCPMDDSGCANGSAYAVDNAPVSDSGNYRVLITNPAGTTASNTASVTVIGPPAIVTNPQSQAAFLGQPFLLSVTAAGGSLSYQWRLNQQPIAGAQTSTYMVQSAAGTDAGAYDVVVSNGAGTATSAVANVTVNGPPTIISDLVDQSLYAGLSFTLRVTAAGVGLQYAWFQNGMPLVDDTNLYSIGSAQLSDAGNYQVQISNGAGSVMSRVAMVVIDGAPVVTTQPTGATLFAGQPFTVSITATGEDLAYQWRQNEAAIPGANAPIYTVPAAAVTDSGSYDCVVVNPAGSVTSGEALVSVNGAPVITTQPVSAAIVRGAPLALSVVAAGADLQYQWSKDGQPIGDATASSFAIAAAADTDSGSYTCQVSNEAGAATSNPADITIVQCLADSDCSAADICQAQTCVPKPIPIVYGCANGGAACDPGSSCDVATNSCKVDALVGGCASADGVTALSLLALLFIRRGKRDRVGNS